MNGTVTPSWEWYQGKPAGADDPQSRPWAISKDQIGNVQGNTWGAVGMRSGNATVISRANITTSGTISYKTFWYSKEGRPAPLPPAGGSYYILETSTASWTVQGVLGSGTGDVGENPIYGHNGYLDTVTSRRLKQFRGTTTTSTSPTLSASVQAQFVGGTPATYTDSSNGIYGPYINVSVDYGVAPDSRGVTLSCYPMEPNYHKGANDLPEANVRADDGSMAVDSTPTWNHYIVNQGAVMVTINAWTIENTVITANAIGFQEPTRSDWSSSGDGSVSNGLFDKWNTTLSMPLSNTMPSSSNVTVKVSDLRKGMEATANAKYSIKWHTPYENWVAVGPSSEIEGTPSYFHTDHDIYRRSGGDITARFKGDGPYLGDWSWVGTAVSFGQLITLGDYDLLYKSFLTIIGADMDAPSDEPGSITWDELWTLSKPVGVSDADKEKYYLTNVTGKTVDLRQAYKGDGYGAKGYKGKIQKYVQYYERIKFHAEAVAIVQQPNNH